jgi:hypothetical protein
MAISTMVLIIIAPIQNTDEKAQSVDRVPTFIRMRLNIIMMEQYCEYFILRGGS